MRITIIRTDEHGDEQSTRRAWLDEVVRGDRDEDGDLVELLTEWNVR